ncbi:23S rRNA (pseudouridine(1915)-N(3))-methyltransferase RlmH [candidate division KSB1 bacterium]|nr:23S rRNA (pseudouridine(1915)-N(3))-methyltransferase RlmH [candidate division KSB1 bacterium]
MKIEILTVGKPQNDNMKNLSQDYLKRISRYLPVELIWVKGEKIASLPAQEIMQREAVRLQQRIDADGYTVVLDRSGKMVSSTAFAGFIQKRQLESTKKLTIIIGGPLGLPDNFRKAASITISLSKMTFAHELTLVIVLEQIYRAMSIQHGSKYHK